LPIVVSVSESQAQFYGKFETPVGLVHNSAVERASHESRKCPCTLPDHNSPATIASGKDAASARVPLGHDRAPWVRDLAISLSLANLCFLNLWSKLQSNYFDYFRNAPADPKAALSRLGALLASILLLTLVLWSAAVAVRRSRRPATRKIGQGVFLLPLIIALNVLRTEYRVFSLEHLRASLGTTGFVLLGLLVLAGALLIVVLWGATILKVAQVLVLILLPFLPLAFVQTAWQIFHPLPLSVFCDKPLAPALRSRGPAAPRIIWVVFDELDQGLTFLQRPPTVRMPEMDQLRAESVYASHVHRPGYDTLDAMPALIAGQLASRPDVRSPSDLRVALRNAPGTARFGAHPNVFSRARDWGFNTAVVGWYHPYCRLFNDTLSACFWEPAQSQFSNEEPPQEFFENMRLLLSRQLVKIPLLGHFGLAGAPPWADPENRERSRRRERAEYLRLREAALRRITDPDLGLLLLHLPVPHLPGIYSRATNDLSIEDGTTYLDNLVLVDRTMGELRATLLKAGLWDRTTLLVTGDHPLRISELISSGIYAEEERLATGGKQCDWVPFVLKLAYQRQALTYDSPFNAVLTHDLLLAILRGELSTPESVLHWLDHNRAAVPVPGS